MLKKSYARQKYETKKQFMKIILDIITNKEITKQKVSTKTVAIALYAKHVRLFNYDNMVKCKPKCFQRKIEKAPLAVKSALSKDKQQEAGIQFGYKEKFIID